MEFPQKVASLVLIAPQFKMPQLLLRFQREITAYAKDAIDDFDASILDAIKNIQINNLDSDFAAQVQQYLRVKILFSGRRKDLEKDSQRILVRIIEILND